MKFFLGEKNLGVRYTLNSPEDVLKTSLMFLSNCTRYEKFVRMHEITILDHRLIKLHEHV